MNKKFASNDWKNYIPKPICEDFPEYNAFYEKELDNWSVHPKELDNRSASSLPQLKMKFNHVIKEYCVRNKKTPKSLSFKAIVIESFNQSKESYVFMTNLK